MFQRLLAGLSCVVLVACGDGTGPPPPPPPAECASPATVTLAPGQHGVFDPAASTGCVRLPAVAAETEYLVALVSGNGTETTNGVSGPYYFQAVVGGVAAVPAVEPSVGPERAGRGPGAQAVMDRALRARERELSSTPGIRFSLPAAPPVAVPPAVGSQREFSVCSNISCTQFDTVVATAKYVGLHAAVYIDDMVPTAEPLQPSDFDDLGRTFDMFHYPIDIEAFGAVSDMDGNSVVAILLTDAVNALTTDCANGRVLGFFWGGDLLTIQGSNRGEVFYGMVPQPASPTCPVATRSQTVARLKPTLIHELQHMISWNQHVTLRAGQSEHGWLNEALSHLAEELAGRLIPNGECPGAFSCRSLYTSGNLLNAYDYLDNTEGHFLVIPQTSSATLEERGASWLFLRWVIDRFGTGVEGANLTRAMVQTSLTGVANLQAATGQQFPTLTAESFLAWYVDDLPGFTPASPRMRVDTWGLRQVFLDNCCNPPDPDKLLEQEWPVDAPLITSSFARLGTLRGGSGRHFRVIQGAGSQPLDLLVARNAALDGIDAALAARLGIVRVR